MDPELYEKAKKPLIEALDEIEKVKELINNNHDELREEIEEDGKNDRKTR